MLIAPYFFLLAAPSRAIMIFYCAGVMLSRYEQDVVGAQVQRNEGKSNRRCQHGGVHSGGVIKLRWIKLYHQTQEVFKPPKGLI